MFDSARRSLAVPRVGASSPLRSVAPAPHAACAADLAVPTFAPEDSPVRTSAPAGARAVVAAHRASTHHSRASAAARPVVPAVRHVDSPACRPAPVDRRATEGAQSAHVCQSAIIP